MSVKAVKNLSLWFQKNARTLPWRKNRDPYRIWLSEIMLQQTQVATVIPYFERFLSEFKSVGDLARAPLDRVLALWAGLGYYSRARNLHRGAQALAQRLDEGRGFPKNRTEWLEIPGVGPYTAGAICSIAYDQPEPLVDGNVVRVLSRFHAIADPGPGKAEIWKRATRWVQTPGAVPSVLNQALMELGATVCRPTRPDCGACPVRASCRGKRNPGDFPEKRAARAVIQLREKKWILFRLRKDRPVQAALQEAVEEAVGADFLQSFEVFLRQNPEGVWRAGLWDFPDASDVPVKRAALRGEFTLRYAVTRHRVTREHLCYQIEGRMPEGASAGRWFSLGELPGVPAPVKKALKNASFRMTEAGQSDKPKAWQKRKPGSFSSTSAPR